MGNSMKTPVDPLSCAEDSDNVEVSSLPPVPLPPLPPLAPLAPLAPLPPLLNTDEINARNKKWQEEKEEYERKMQEQNKKDEMYKNVDLTKEFLQQNIAKESWIEFQSHLTKFLTKDIYGFDILRINLLEYGLKGTKYINSVKIQFVSKDFDDETINVLLRNAKYNLTFDTYDLIFYGDFVQNQNLLLSNNLENYIILPNRITEAYNYISLNILNIKKLSPLLDDAELKILVSTVEFNEFAEGRINYKYCFDQYYERNDGTWNKLNIGERGLGNVCYSMNIPINKKDATTDEAPDSNEE